MAQIPVANPFRQQRPAPIKRRAKPVVEWSLDDQQQAHVQGWGLFEIVDEQTRKVFFEIQLHGVRFDNDGYARAFVMDRNKAGDELAIKAFRAVYRSKAGDHAKA